jgi:putative Holliday junction resolvase
VTTGVTLGLDYGRKRIGVAVSTPLGTVHPRPRLERTTIERDLEALKGIVEETAAARIVVGLPHHMDGTTSEMEEEVRRFAVALAAACGVPVYGTDERLTSEAAERILRARDVRGRANRERRDSAAASLVLQDFLEAGNQGERIA